MSLLGSVLTIVIVVGFILIIIAGFSGQKPGDLLKKISEWFKDKDDGS